jgi:hypothetical protein
MKQKFIFFLERNREKKLHFFGTASDSQNELSFDLQKKKKLAGKP